MLNLLQNLLEPKTNGHEVASLMAKLLNVRISQTTLKKEIEEHPDYPSLLSISDVLNNYGIENLAIKIDAAKLAEIPIPCVTHIKAEKSSFEYFTVVKKITGEQVQFFDPEKHDWASIAKDDFVSRFSGIVLLAEARETAGEKDYVKNIKAEKRERLGQYILTGCFPVLLFAAATIAFAQAGSGALIPFLFLVCTLAGCCLSVLLLWYEVDQHNPALQQICTAGKKVNCGAVLQSKAAKIAGISWSVIGFTYFMGILLLMLFWGLDNPATLFALSWLNLVALPYIVFSIYYQWSIAKQWCVLCLGVQAILALQFASAIIGGWHGIMPVSTFFTPILLLQTFTAFALPFIASAVALPALQKAKESKQINTTLQKLKHNQQVFETLLSKQKIITESTDGLGITLGGHEAKFKIIKVCNPYCAPCSKAHAPMHALIKNNPNIQLQILFTASNDEGDKRGLIVNHLLSIAEQGEERLLLQALDDWYLSDSKNYDVFANKYPLNEKLTKHSTQIDRMNEWCKKMDITITPTFFVNGSKLANIYNIADLKYFFLV